MSGRAVTREAGGLLRDGLVFLFTWTGLGVLAVWGAGRILNDRLGWSQYLWWLPSAAAAALAGGCLVLAAIAGRRRRSGSRCVLACGLGACIAWTGLIEWHGLRGRSGAGAGRWRILFWNMASKDAPGAPALLEREHPELIVLANPAYSASRGAIEASLARSHTLIELPECLIAWRGEVRGSGWTSLRLGAARPGMDPAQGPSAIDDGWAAWGTLETGEGREIVLWVVDVPADPGLVRTRLMQRIARAIAASRIAFPAPDLIVGDFNTPRGSASLRALVGGMSEVFSTRGVGPGATWPRRVPLWALDQVFTGEALAPVAARVIDPGSGTHRAVVAEVAPVRD